MKKRNIRSTNKNYWKAVAFTLLLAAWVSITALTGSVKADGTPVILIRTATLTSPTGSINPHGAAAWQLYQSGNREIEVEIEDVNFSMGTSLGVYVDGNLIGQAIVDDRQRGKLKLRTEDGQAVPVANAGSTVDVRSGSTILVSGAFDGSTPTPSGSGTASPSPSQSGTGTATPSPSQSSTGTATPSPSQSGTGTATPSPSQSGTGTGTGTPSPSPSGTPILVMSAALNSPTGSINPHGASVWQLYSNGNREIEVEVEDLSLAQGTVLTAFVDGSNIGTLTVDDRQKAKLKLRTEDGQAVPTVNNGSNVEVRNGNSVLVNGIFGSGSTTTPTITPSQSGTGTATPSPSQSGTGTATPSATGTPNNESELFAGLTGPTVNGVLPTGFAEYEIHSSRTELEVRVRQINLAIGTSLNVFVDGTVAGQMSLQSGGEGRLRLRSDNGQTVPVVVVGSTIAVKNGDSNILSGTFSGFGTPNPTQTGTASPSQTGTPNGTPSPTPFGRSFESHLNGSQVVPPVTTAARGEIKVTLSADETQATVFGEFHNLSSNQTGALIETTVGTTVTIRDLGVVGGQNGNFAAATFAVSAAQVQQLRAGLWSAVIMSVNNPAGEISGQFRNHSRHSDFDGDGQHDFAVFRPSTGTWYSQNSSGFSSQTLGSASDKIVSADFDGDGRTDAAVYRNENGQGVWQIARSSDAGVTRVNWGLSTDVPLRADFDGDGRIDVAVYRPTEGLWCIQQSNNTGERYIYFGNASDIPVPADMDGDGKDDFVVYRPSEGNWYWMRSLEGRYLVTNYGTSGDIPVSGDFDGDGKGDITVFRPSNGTWYTKRSSDGGFQAQQFGLAGDIPVAGNYDADGKTDIAVFRPSNGYWYVLRTSDGTFQQYQFGLNGDIPAIAR